MNITKHAMIRYLSRIKKVPEIINEQTYDTWKRNNESIIKEAEVEIQNLFSSASFFTKGQFGNNKEADFYLLKSEMLIFVIQKDSILTCYEISYDIDHKGNKEIFKAYLRSLQRLENKQEELLNKNKQEKTELTNEITNLNIKIEELKTKIKYFEETKELLNQQIKLLTLTEEEISEQIHNAKDRIIRSKIVH
ncbi:hypothetical protein [Fusobacterium necrophorum]|uniref:hypothetical protein n=1 Tax=Fusobacterium necrophorum TaxID=859 RepID=UPI00254B32C9|nr:hypothetical protein [Fusobacterium necrophorum]MDK4524983.1 BREX-1 system adenine-specific DNA-methyltransferase PglX [Fusobacterium necrophorum]